MKKNLKLKYLILLSLTDDDERFESIYYSVNELPYVNPDPECGILHDSLSKFPIAKKYSVEGVFELMKGLINNRYILCLNSIRNGDKLTLKRIHSPDYRKFKLFASYWLRLTHKGRNEIA